jgi:hypothetical protein
MEKIEDATNDVALEYFPEVEKVYLPQISKGALNKLLKFSRVKSK